MLILWQSTEMLVLNRFLTVEIMAKIKLKQIRSGIGRPARQKRTLIALGIRKMNQTVEHEATPQIMGMIDKVRHLVEISE